MTPRMSTQADQDGGGDPAGAASAATRSRPRAFRLSERKVAPILGLQPLGDRVRHPVPGR